MYVCVCACVCVCGQTTCRGPLAEPQCSAIFRRMVFPFFLSLGVVESVACWSGEADHRNMLPPCLTADFSANRMWKDTNA